MFYPKVLLLSHPRIWLWKRTLTFSLLVGIIHVHVDLLTHINRVLAERIMRVLVCNGFAGELGPGQYEPTHLSRQMTERKTIGTMDSLYVFCLAVHSRSNSRSRFVDFLPIIQKTPEFFQKSGYKNPGDPKDGPLQHAYNTSGSCWDWLAENPEALDRFNTFMEGSRDEIAHWADWFPVQERLLDASLDGRPLLVDVGGNRGHELVGFKERFPSGAGKLVLEDLPTVIEDIQTLDSDIERVKHDFFSPQPVKGSLLFFLAPTFSNRYYRCSRILLQAYHA